jgi:hypothetical protein
MTPLRVCGAIAAALLLGAGAETATAQAPSGSHVTIPFLANASKPADLEFEAAECELNATRDGMTCAFQQLFLTTSDIAPDTCLVTTNRYERTFRRETSTRWVSSEGTTGECGVLDIATLQDDGGVRWTMEMRKVVTKKDASAACSGVDTRAETFSWQNLRRPLPCKFVQPGGLRP